MQSPALNRVNAELERIKKLRAIADTYPSADRKRAHQQLCYLERIFRERRESILARLYMKETA